MLDQISLPMRIALAATLVFAALWFVALRPKPVEPVDGSLPSASATESDAGAQATATETPAKADPQPKAEASEPKSEAKTDRPANGRATRVSPGSRGSKAVLADLDKGRVVVLLFSSLNDSSDGRAVRRAVAEVDRHGGKVRVHTARMSRLPQYEAIVKATPVTTSPSVLVIDRKAQARVIGGLTTTREINALVDRALKVR